MRCSDRGGRRPRRRRPPPEPQTAAARSIEAGRQAAARGGGGRAVAGIATKPNRRFALFPGAIARAPRECAIKCTAAIAQTNMGIKPRN